MEGWPLEYLGLPLGGNHRSRSFWDPVVERAEKRLARWKRSYISVGRRIMLIKVALANIPMYYMSLFKMFVYIAKKIEQLQRNFLWKGCSEKKGPLAEVEGGL